MKLDAVKIEAQEQKASSLLRKAKAFEVFKEVAVIATCMAGAFQLTQAIPRLAHGFTLPSWFEQAITAFLGVAIGAFALREKSGGRDHD